MHSARLRPPSRPSEATIGAAARVLGAAAGCCTRAGQSTWFSHTSNAREESRLYSLMTSASALPRMRRAMLFMVGASSSNPPWVVEVLALLPLSIGVIEKMTSPAAEVFESKPNKD